MNSDVLGDLKLGNLFEAAGLAPEDVTVIRHTLTPDGMTRDDALGPNLLTYTREQGRRNSKLGKVPGRIWLNFLATTGRRARFLTAFENHGEVLEEGTDVLRYFDLQPSPVFSSHRHRLLIEWTADTVNWAKSGPQALSMPVVEITDPLTKPFPGFDSIIVSFNELQAIIDDDRYKEWRTALSSVQGIYLIADTKSGKLYVGKADGAGGFLGRWGEYARTGHGATSPLGNWTASISITAITSSSASCRSSPPAPPHRRSTPPRPTSRRHCSPGSSA
jgi:hypothetical protein